MMHKVKLSREYLEDLLSLMGSDIEIEVRVPDVVSPVTLGAVRAKMNCNALETREYSATYKQLKVELGAVCGKEGEDKDFSKYTPSGACWMNIEPDCLAANFFKPGKRYYVTFTEAPD